MIEHCPKSLQKWMGLQLQCQLSSDLSQNGKQLIQKTLVKPYLGSQKPFKVIWANENTATRRSQLPGGYKLTTNQTKEGAK